jgi:hypothetical protein
MDTTPCLGLKTVIPGQAQKETSINEGLHLLDAIVAGAVEEPARTDPPATPVVGTSYLVASNAVGEWVGHDGALAAFTLGGWRFVAPIDGLAVFEKATGTTLRYRSGAWEQVLGSRQAAIPDVTGGMTMDAESRAAISAILSALRAHGLIAA